ncbi:MAG: hypothetical protein R6U58_11975, partial [Bacteroidales bacterium]
LRLKPCNLMAGAAHRCVPRKGYGDYHFIQAVTRNATVCCRRRSLQMLKVMQVPQVSQLLD